MKPTREQVEKFIKSAELELGPETEDPYVAWCSKLLRSAVEVNSTLMVLDEDGRLGIAQISIVGGGGGGPSSGVCGIGVGGGGGGRPANHGPFCGHEGHQCMRADKSCLPAGRCLGLE